jgi:hypothetical protein
VAVLLLQTRGSQSGCASNAPAILTGR